MKKLLLALTFILFAQSAWAQGNPTCPTRPFGDNSNACASTAFVQAAIVGACTATGAFEVGTGASSQCSTVAVSSAHVGATSDLYDFWIAKAGTPSGVLLSLQYGKGGNLYTPLASNNIINLQSLIDSGASGSGLAWNGMAVDMQLQAGTRGTAVGGDFRAATNGTWSGIATDGGATGIFAKASVNGAAGVFGGNSWAEANTTNSTAAVVSWEFDTNCAVNCGSKTGVQIVDVSTSTGTVSGNSVALHFLNQIGAAGWDYAITMDTGSGAQFPIKASGGLWKAGGGTITNGIDFSTMTFSGGRWLISGNNQALGSYNNAGLAVKNLLKLDTSDLLNLYDGISTLSAAGLLTTPSIGAFTLAGTISGGNNQINNIVIGTTTPRAGSFTTITGSGVLNLTGAQTIFTAGNSTSGATNFAGATFTGGTTSFNFYVLSQGYTTAAQFTAASTLFETIGVGGFSYSSSTAGTTHRWWINGTLYATLSATAFTLPVGTVSTSATTGSLVNTGGFGNGGEIWNAGNYNVATAAKTVVLKQGANGSVGTFICTGAGTITISNTNFATSDTVIISMATAGGTITTPPAFKTVTGATGFTVLCGATDTSTYNYAIIKNAAWLIPPANDNEPFPWANKAFA